MIIQPRKSKLKVWHLLVAAPIIGFFASMLHTAVTNGATGSYEPVRAPFDHSMCQYPERLSNPPNGCDNSDPARPECMKFGTEDCDLPYPTLQEIPTCKE